MSNTHITRREKTTVIKRGDIERIHEYARNNCCLRDFLLFRLPMKIGLRTGEICTLRIENIDFEDHSFMVLDSKKKELFPLPLDTLTLQLIQDLIGNRKEGYVFRHLTSWKNTKKDQPLSRVEVWNIIHDVALKVGISHFNPRMLRCYFAAHWVYVKKKRLITLQHFMRHSSLDFTSIYVNHLSFWEDDKKEYDDVKNDPFQETEQEVNKVAGGTPPISLEASICKFCSHLHLCKFQPLPSCVTSCRFKLVKTEGIAQYH